MGLLIILIAILVAIIVARKSKELELEEAIKETYRHKDELVAKFGKLSPDEIVFSQELERNDKIILLVWAHGYSDDEAAELLETKDKTERRAKLSTVKRKITQKAEELYGNIPTDDSRAPISEDVKAFVWRRDNGKCVKCGSQEKLEFDHIIPHSKGGSDTERNIQLLCEKCNRSKGAGI